MLTQVSVGEAGAVAVAGAVDDIANVVVVRIVDKTGNVDEAGIIVVVAGPAVEVGTPTGTVHIGTISKPPSTQFAPSTGPRNNTSSPEASVAGQSWRTDCTVPPALLEHMRTPVATLQTIPFDCGAKKMACGTGLRRYSGQRAELVVEGKRRGEEMVQDIAASPERLFG